MADIKRDNETGNSTTELGSGLPSWSREVGSRIKGAVDRVGGLEAASKLMDKSVMQVRRYISGESEPPFGAVVALARAADMDLSWIASGRSTKADDADDFTSSAAGLSAIPDRTLVAIPRFEKSPFFGHRLAPGYTQVSERIALSETWISDRNINPDKLGLVRVDDRSMAPTIPAGAIAVVDTGDEHVEREGVYSFSRDGEPQIKRLVPVAPGPDGHPTSIVIISDGGTVAPEFLTGPQLNELRIVGRVRCILVNM